MAEEIEMQRGVIVSATDIRATVVRQSANGEYCFVVDVEDTSEPHGWMKLWCADDLDENLVKRLRENSQIQFSAERDDEGDMVITELKLL